MKDNNEYPEKGVKKSNTVELTELQLLAQLDSIRNNTYDLGLSPNKRRSWFKSYLKNAHAAGIHLQPANNDYAVKVIEERIKQLEVAKKVVCEYPIAVGIHSGMISELNHILKLLLTPNN